ncbi:Clp protease N-terminal domain-containing protein [Jonesiaceae bacterium BS-20]|uniref:Clp protease N-terminal domain-containing protein n=1 Tax=Jonesiaceae bacterium BS-20 TaxID=3120821 RepID=A0AAU7E0N0_9MICO
MNKFVRTAQTNQSLSLAAMEEASRTGLREADIDHLFLALVINDQAAGRVLRECGISIEGARRAVQEQHGAQLAELGIEAVFPQSGQIVFHQTNGYQWSKRAADILARSAGKNKDGDASAVLRELLAEPSGLITGVLGKLRVTSAALLGELELAETLQTPGTFVVPQVKGWMSSSTSVFVPAPVAEVREFLIDPAKVPEWHVGVGSIELDPETLVNSETLMNSTWSAHAPVTGPNGKATKIKPQFRRLHIERSLTRHDEQVEWRITHPDSPRNRPLLTTIVLVQTTGGTQVSITNAWQAQGGWRKPIAWVLRPIQKFFVWFQMFHMGGATSRAFR